MVEEQQRMAKKIEELEARIAEYRNPQQRKDLFGGEAKPSDLPETMQNVGTT
jgi:hypothetical protein